MTEVETNIQPSLGGFGEPVLPPALLFMQYTLVVFFGMHRGDRCLPLHAFCLCVNPHFGGNMNMELKRPGPLFSQIASTDLL